MANTGKKNWLLHVLIMHLNFTTTNSIFGLENIRLIRTPSKNSTPSKLDGCNGMGYFMDEVIFAVINAKFAIQSSIRIKRQLQHVLNFEVVLCGGVMFVFSTPHPTLFLGLTYYFHIFRTRSHLYPL